MIPCHPGGLPLDRPDGAKRDSVPDMPASWLEAGLARRRPGGTVHVSARVLRGGGVEVVVPGLGEGAAVDVYVVATEGAAAPHRW